MGEMKLMGKGRCTMRRACSTRNTRSRERSGWGSSVGPLLWQLILADY